jgi:hypothetical protein
MVMKAAHIALRKLRNISLDNQDTHRDGISGMLGRSALQDG